MTHHTPVLVEEILAQFQGKKLRTFFDGTLGAAGHAAAILEAHPEIDIYIGCDRDDTALKIAKEKLHPWESKVRFVKGNYENVDQIIDEVGVSCLSGMLLDLGVSSMQLDQTERGFSFSKDAPLDMRMDRSEKMTAAEVVNQCSEKDLQHILRDLGEEPHWKKIAAAIVQARQKKPIRSTKELAQIIQSCTRGKKGLHPATLSFQGIRIYVNKELSSLERGVRRAVDILCPEGRLAIISFHSLEDRIVKNTFKFLSGQKMFIDQVHSQGPKLVEILTKKPIIPGDTEVEQNPRSRSSKLRIVEKLQEAV